MKSMKLLLSLAAALLAFSGTANAQDDDGHGLISVRTTTVKPGKGLEFRELLGKLSASRRAAGHTGTAIYQVVRGPSGVFYSVGQIDDYARFDGQYDSGMSDADWQRWLNRLNEIIAHSELMVMRTHPELGIAAESESPPNMLMLRFTTLNPGAGGDYHDWLENSLVPALREGNSKSYSVSDIRIGGDPSTWISARRIDSWAQLDGPGPLSHLSNRARERVFDGWSDMIHSSRVEMIRLLPDLSY